MGLLPTLQIVNLPPTVSNLEKTPRLHWWLLGSWFILNLLQATFTTLMDDEAYYWLYGQYLDWGFYHQPPMIGLFTKIGDALVGGELGVRLVSVIANTLAVHLLFLTTNRKDVLLFWAIIAGSLISHVAGWIAAPDSPLIIFSALFLYTLKKYQEKDSWLLSVALGAIAALMLYGKYHGILVLGFGLLANVKLLRRPSFYVIPVVATLVFLPHALWQINHDFPGFGYHLSGRFDEYFNPEHIFGFFLDQLIIAGPLLGFVTLTAAFKQKVSNDFVRTLKFVLIGELVYFFYWSFKGPIEANWTATGLLCMFWLAYEFAHERVKWRKWVLYLSAPSILLFMGLRVMMIFPSDSIVSVYQKWGEFHDWERFLAEIQAVGPGRPILADSYQNASKLSFYSGEVVPSMNQYAPGNEFDLWNFEAQYNGKDVLVLIGESNRGGTEVISPKGEKMYVIPFDNIQLLNKVEFSPVNPEQVLTAGDTNTMLWNVHNPYDYRVYCRHDGKKWNGLAGHWRQDGELVLWDGIRTWDIDLPQGDTVVELNVLPPEEPGIYTYEPSIITRKYGWWSAKKIYEFEVK